MCKVIELEYGGVFTIHLLANALQLSHKINHFQSLGMLVGLKFGMWFYAVISQLEDTGVDMFIKDLHHANGPQSQ